jgi:plastocyanin
MKPMRRLLVVAFAVGLSGCGGYGGSAIPPTSPGPPAANAIVIEIIGINGSKSFSPNPATLPAGQSIVWHNADTTTHDVVFNDGELDTGNIAPGAFSTPMAPLAAGPYHCSIHPEMVGTAADGR